jgi:hypothetical protein
MDQQANPGATTRARSEGEQALAQRWSASLLRAGSVFAAFVLVICVPLASGLVALGKFNLTVLVTLGLAAIGVFPVAFFGWELHRLYGCRHALQRMVVAEETFVDLLRDTRRERDAAIAERDAILLRSRIELEALRAVDLVKDHLSSEAQETAASVQRGLK